MKKLFILGLMVFVINFAIAQSNWNNLGKGIVWKDISYIHKISNSDLNNLGKGIVWNNISYIHKIP